MRKAAEGAKAAEKAATEAVEGATKPAGEGIVYLRTNANTGGQYVGRAESEARFEARKVEHAGKNPDADYRFQQIGNAQPGMDLRVQEQKKMNELGGPERYGGPLENKRNEISADRWEELGIDPVDVD